MSITGVTTLPDLVLDFINTIALESAGDAISKPESLRSWLLRHDLIDEPDHLSVEDVARAAELRAELRALIGVNTGGGLPPGSREVINRAGRAAPIGVAVSESGGVYLRPAASPPVDRAVGAILAAVYASTADGSWARLKLCSNPQCRRAFYDRSKNRSGRWCSMAGCGSRSKSRRYRIRRRLGKEQV